MKNLSWILIIGGVVGILMSAILTLDKIALLENPAVELPCNINPLISCGPIINTPQASAFGIPNPLVGLVGYSIVLTIGVLLATGTIIDRKIWKLFLLGLLFAELFIHWLIFQSVFVIGNLCLYCMVTWVFTWPVFLYTLKSYWSSNFLNKNHLAILTSWYLLILLIILTQFRDFFFS